MAWRKTLKGKWSSYSSYSELNSDHHQLSSWEHIKENQQIVDLNSKMVAIFGLFHNIWSPSPHKALYYSNDIPYWQSTFYSPLFILYWRQQIPPPFSLKILWSPKSCNHFPPSLPPPKTRILTGLKVKILFTGGILHLISGWRYNKLFEGLFFFQKIIIV